MTPLSTFDSVLKDEVWIGPHAMVMEDIAGGYGIPSNPGRRRPTLSQPAFPACAAMMTLPLHLLLFTKRIHLELVGVCLAALTFSISSQAQTALLGVQQGPGCTGTQRIVEFSKWLGREPALMLDYLDDRSWWHLTQTGWWTGCWSKAQRKPALSIPMLPRGGSGATLAQGAAGAYDDTFRKIAENLVAAGFDDLVLRIGWEFNAEWFSWRAGADPASWVAYWRRIVTTMRSVPGARFRFDWCPAYGTRQIDPERIYPGDAYVDVIGMDIYNASWANKDPVARWNELMNSPNGLKWHRDFARAHAKPMSYPEWGTGTNAGGTGGGDDAYFIAQMAAWMRANPVVYQIYWDDTSSFNAKLSNGQQPAAAAAYLREFGP